MNDYEERIRKMETELRSMRRSLSRCWLLIFILSFAVNIILLSLNHAKELQELDNNPDAANKTEQLLHYAIEDFKSLF